jgi:hypothetical protein
MKVIYSCLFGTREKLLNQNQQFKDKQSKYMLFTDQKDLNSNFWDIVYLEKEALPDRRTSRLPKILPYRWLPEIFKQSIYIDNSVLITSNLTKYWELLDDCDFIMFPHPSRDNVIQEVNHLIKLQHYEHHKMREMISEYEKLGFDLNTKLGMGTILIRNHSTEIAKKQQDIWIQQVLYGSERDQISMGYSLWKSKLQYKFINNSIRSNVDFKWPTRTQEQK